MQAIRYEVRKFEDGEMTYSEPFRESLQAIERYNEYRDKLKESGVEYDAVEMVAVIKRASIQTQLVEDT